MARTTAQRAVEVALQYLHFILAATAAAATATCSALFAFLRFRQFPLVAIAIVVVGVASSSAAAASAIIIAAILCALTRFLRFSHYISVCYFVLFCLSSFCPRVCRSLPPLSPLSPPLPLSLCFFFALFSPSCLLIYSITVSLLARGHELSASLTVSCAECVFVCVCAECICG